MDRKTKNFVIQEIIVLRKLLEIKIQQDKKFYEIISEKIKELENKVLTTIGLQQKI